MSKTLHCFAVMVLIAAGQIRAGPILMAVDFTTASEHVAAANTIYGWQFTVNSPISIDGIAFWDVDSDGIVERHDVGIWGNIDTQPVLIFSATVTNGYDPIPSMWANGGWRLNPVGPRNLAPGRYIIGGTSRGDLPGTLETLASDAVLVTQPQITFGGARMLSNASMLACPTEIPSNEYAGIFGPNFSIVPEPYFAASCMVGAMFCCCRRRR